MVSGSGWNLWVWLVGVVVRRYIDFFILFIPTPLLSVFFSSLFLYFLKLNFMYEINFSRNINTHTGDYGRPTAAI